MFRNRNSYTRISAPETRWEREQRLAREKAFWESNTGRCALAVILGFAAIFLAIVMLILRSSL